MWRMGLGLSAILLVTVLAWGQQEVTPPTIREAEKARSPIDESPPVFARAYRTPDPAQLRSEADELSELAKSVPSQVAQASRGRLPKDLNERLKRIEKLAKKLRRDLAP
jgi:hypothetical protein